MSEDNFATYQENDIQTVASTLPFTPSLIISEGHQCLLSMILNIIF